jgi:hypothetical protein
MKFLLFFLAVIFFAAVDGVNAEYRCSNLSTRDVHDPSAFLLDAEGAS